MLKQTRASNEKGDGPGDSAERKMLCARRSMIRACSSRNKRAVDKSHSDVGGVRAVETRWMKAVLWP